MLRKYVKDEFFKQDVVQPYFIVLVRNYLDLKLECRWSSSCSLVVWPSTFVDITPCDFSLLVETNSYIFTSSSTTIAKVSTKIRDAINSISKVVF